MLLVTPLLGHGEDSINSDSFFLLASTADLKSNKQMFLDKEKVEFTGPMVFFFVSMVVESKNYSKTSF